MTYEDYVEKILKLINSSTDVALWGASNDSIVMINLLKERCVRPRIIIDSDPNKSNKEFMSIPVMTYESAKELYPNLYVFIVGSNYKYQIIGNLTEKYFFPKERIINYEPVVKRKGCMFIENAMLCVGHSFRFCSSDFGKKNSPQVPFSGDYISSLDEWKRLREEISDKLRNGLETSCDGCCCVEEDYYSIESKVSLLNFSEGGICNFKCEYCTAAAKHSKGSYDRDIDLTEVLGFLDKNNMISYDLHIDYSPGEPALYQNRRKVYDSFDGKHITLAMTNASVFDEELGRCITSGKCTLCVSVDAGTSNTFAKIKGVDMFERVCVNLQRYAEIAEGAVGLKYIFIPGVNDNKDDIDGFIVLCNAVKPGITLISYDIFHPVQKLSAYTFEIVKYMIHSLDRDGHVWKNVSDVVARAFKRDIL